MNAYLSRAEICDLEYVLCRNHDIGRLDVSMDDALRVDVLQCLNQLPKIPVLKVSFNGPSVCN